ITGDDLATAGVNAVIGAGLSGTFGYYFNRLVPLSDRHFRIIYPANSFDMYRQNVGRLFAGRAAGSIPNGGVVNPYEGFKMLLKSPTPLPSGLKSFGTNAARTLANQVGGNTVASAVQPLVQKGVGALGFGSGSRPNTGPDYLSMLYFNMVGNASAM